MSVFKKNLFPFVLFILPVLVAFYAFFEYSLNIPFWDDFDTVFLFLSEFTDTETFTEKLKLIFSQHTEHRFALNRLMVLFNSIFGAINLRFLMLLGNLALIGLLAIVFYSSNIKSNKLWLMLPVPLLLFQPQYNESIFWATAALCNFYVSFFAFLSIFLLLKATDSQKIKKRFFVLSIFFAFMSLYTMGNGILVLPIALAILIYRKKYKTTALYLIPAVGFVMLYFTNYITPANHPGLLESLSHPVRLFTHFFSMIGAPVGLFGMRVVAPLAGITILLYFLFVTYKGYYKKNIAIYSLLLFLFMTAFTISLLRSGFGIEQAFASKYMIVSIFFYILSYISFIEIFPIFRQKKYLVGFIIIALGFNVGSYVVNFKHIISHRNSLITSMQEWREDGKGLLFPDEEKANMLMTEVIDRKMFTPPSE